MLRLLAIKLPLGGGKADTYVPTPTFPTFTSDEELHGTVMRNFTTAFVSKLMLLDLNGIQDIFISIHGILRYMRTDLKGIRRLSMLDMKVSQHEAPKTRSSDPKPSQFFKNQASRQSDVLLLPMLLAAKRHAHDVSMHLSTC